MIYKVLMFGDRNWTKRGPVVREVRRLKAKADRRGFELLVIHGKATGADQMAGQVAQEMNCHVAEVPALWQTRHRTAGPQRNQMMLYLQPHEGVAFHANLAVSKGTADMKRRLDRAGIPVKLVTG